MRREGFVLLLLVFALSGCVVRTYSVTKERVDQNLQEGNLGYLKGEASGSEKTKERKTTRTTQVIETEIFAPIRFEGSPKKKAAQATGSSSDSELWGNRGYIGTRAQSQEEEQAPVYAEKSFGAGSINFKPYTVQKGDTLQKISHKFFGTSKNWYKIFKANAGVLRGPDKIYPGQVINIPVEALKETEENLK